MFEIIDARIPGLFIIATPHNGLDIEAQTLKLQADVKTIFRDKRVLHPMCLIQAHTPASCLISVTVIPSAIEFDNALAHVRAIAAEAQADALWFAYEAWGAPIRGTFADGTYKHGDVSKHPERFEMVGMNREQLQGEHHIYSSWCARIERKGRPTLGDWEPTINADLADVAQTQLSYLLTPRVAAGNAS